MFQAIKGYTVGSSLKQQIKLPLDGASLWERARDPRLTGGLSFNSAEQNPLQEALFSNPGLALQPGLECTMPMVVFLQF